MSGPEGMITETITSAQNAKIKLLLELQEKSRSRREHGLFVVEGRRELGHCIEAGYEVSTLFVCPEIVPADETGGILSAVGDNARVIESPRGIYEKVAYRGGTEGVLAEVKWRERSLAELKTGDNPLVIILEGVEKPGNLGAVLRSADAAGADAVLICDPLTDLYNPNLIRASIGAVFTLQVTCCSSEEAISWLQARRIKLFTAQLQDSEWYYDTDMRGATAIAIGTESTGLTDIWRRNADAHIRIPMLGRLDSLNASVSAAILLYEAVRQRHSGQGAE